VIKAFTAFLLVVASAACGAADGTGSERPLTGIIRLSVEGALSGKPTQQIKEPQGTVIDWASVYQSDRNHVEVGRSSIDGPLLPRDTLDYTDVFYVARGSMSIVLAGQKKLSVRKGDFLLLPRGLTMEGRDFEHYVHFAASFETGPGVKSNGPLEVRRLRPNELRPTDFTNDGTNMRHVFYEGAGGVVVRAWQPAMEDMTTEFATAPWTELFTVVSGSGSLTMEDGKVETMKPGDTFLVIRGTRFKFSVHRFRKLAVVFDREP
jgi:uncharacterized cupin superfamily protein